MEHNVQACLQACMCYNRIHRQATFYAPFLSTMHLANMSRCAHDDDDAAAAAAAAAADAIVLPCLPYRPTHTEVYSSRKQGHS